MTDQNYSSEGSEPSAESPEPEVSVGDVLRSAREQQSLSIMDVAQRLKFAPRQIEALEADNHAALPGITFVRGFVRSYAKLLGLDPDALVSTLETAAAREVGPSTVQLQSLTATPQRFPMRQNSARSAWPWIIGMVIAVVGLGGFTLYQWQAPEGVSRPAAENKDAGSTSTAPVVAPNTTPVALPGEAASAGAVVSAPATAGTGEAASAGASVAAAAKPDAAKVPDAAKGNGKIHLVFANESWTEIRQAGGQIVYSKQSAAGSEAWVDGQPPFDLVVGNAQGVKLYYRGSEVDLKPYIKVSVARMQLK